jgi:hypothetical protein
MYHNGTLYSGGGDWRDLEVTMVPSLLLDLKAKWMVSGMVFLEEAGLSTADEPSPTVSWAN